MIFNVQPFTLHIGDSRALNRGHVPFKHLVQRYVFSAVLSQRAQEILEALFQIKNREKEYCGECYRKMRSGDNDDSIK